VRKRLYRSRTDRMLFGVAGGFAEWLEVDPAVVRIVWALLILAGGAGVLLYIVAAIVIPEEPYALGSPAAPGSDAPGGATDPVAVPGPGMSGSSVDRGGRHRDTNGPVILGGLLVLVGGWFLARDLLPAFDDRLVLPGFLIVLGLFLVLGAVRRR
jgi:phage shock protein C